jgi:hypothetical protein
MILEGIEDYMFTCTYKKFFGLECFGCGAQRATVLFFRGEFIAAFKMYPAFYCILLLLLLVVFNFFIKFKHDYQIKITLLYFTVSVMVLSYFYKIF